MTETPERTALERIKALAAGERAPNWAGDRNTYATRCHILDICDAALASSLGEPVSQEAPGLPPGESPQRNAVCDALTEALLYIGVGCGEACERTTIDLEDRVEVRGLARMMTVRDPEGLDGSLGENTKKLWERIGTALASRSAFSGIPRTENEDGFDHGPNGEIYARFNVAAPKKPDVSTNDPVYLRGWNDCMAWMAEDDRERASVISSASPLSEEALRVAFLAGVEDAVGPERCGAEYDAPSREYARRAVDRLSASAPSPE